MLNPWSDSRDMDVVSCLMAAVQSAAERQLVNMLLSCSLRVKESILIGFKMSEPNRK